MRVFLGALERERDAAEIGGVGHCELPASRTNAML
jgi:hypothetical protein